jgi:8-oxo-dGTP pyrophosphatase MutT (NUDIX family)
MNSIEKKELVLGIVQNDVDQVLVVGRMIKEDFADERILYLSFPGGKVEPDEDESQAVEREETGYIVRAQDVIFSGMHEFVPNLKVKYFACEIDTVVREHVKDTAINAVLLIARTELVRTIPTPINPAVLDYLGLKS